MKYISAARNSIKNAYESKFFYVNGEPFTLPNTIYSPTRSSSKGVIAISETEVAKIFSDKEELEKECKHLKFANSINNLAIEFKRADVSHLGNLLIMERLIPLEYRAVEISKRLELFYQFRESMYELHSNGFVFRDINATYMGEGRKCPNIILTDDGLRLVDVGISVLKMDIAESAFDEFVKDEEKAMNGYFKDYFLSTIA